MRGSRTKDKDKAKIIEKKINNPDITLQEIQNQTGINYETARKILKEDLPKVVKSSDNIAELIDVNDNLQSLADTLIADKLKNREETIKISELVSLRESTFKQNQLLRGKVTDRIEVIDQSMLEKVKNGEMDVKSLANELQSFLLNDK